MRVTFIGFNTHPGYAKGRMVNAIKAAARFVDRLPHDRLSPETTDGYERLRASLSDGGVGRSHDRSACCCATSSRTALREQAAAGRAASPREVAAETGTRVEFEVQEQYRNMREVLDRHPEVVERARDRDPPRRTDADREADPRRHRRLAAVVHGPADAQPLRRRAQLPFAPRVDVAPGPRSARSPSSSSSPASGRSMCVEGHLTTRVY